MRGRADQNRADPAVGLATTVEAIDAHSCLLDTGADSRDTLAVYLGMLAVEFSVSDPPELLDHMRTLADRYRRASAGAS